MGEFSFWGKFGQNILNMAHMAHMEGKWCLNVVILMRCIEK